MLKKLFVLGITIWISIAAIFAQNNVTQFMGIPVDGSKMEMIEKLKAKGFTYYESSDYLTGEFNGRDVVIMVATHNNRVWRIMVQDAYMTKNAEDIRIRFNNLCNQFENNKKYIPQNLKGGYEIKDYEDFSYDLIVKEKRFEAAYYQISENDLDSADFKNYFKERVSNMYPPIDIGEISKKKYKNLVNTIFSEYLYDKIAHKSVWFMISREYGDYFIVMYYDNEKNNNSNDL